MKRALLLLPILLLAGCARKPTEQDVVGKWSFDPAGLSGKNQLVAKGGNVTFTNDHKYAMSVNPQISIDGDWSFSEGTVTMTPAALDVASPINAGQRVSIPIQTAMDNFSKLGATPAQMDSLKDLPKPMVLKIRSDGKAMTESDKPALLKAS